MCVLQVIFITFVSSLDHIKADGKTVFQKRLRTKKKKGL